MLSRAKKPKAPTFQMGSDEIRHDCATSMEHTPSDGVGFPIHRHTFKMAATSSFHAKKCRRLAIKQKAHLLSSVRQFLVYSPFVQCFLTRMNAHNKMYAPTK